MVPASGQPNAVDELTRTIRRTAGSTQLDAYRRTSEYGGKEPITLGTAMAISGAAVSPNMGYNSSPLITFLLTLFNVRLEFQAV